MKDSAELIKKCARNCLDVTFEDGYAKFNRFTNEQFELYKKNEAYELRSNCPSSVCLELDTNSSEIQIEYKITREARKWAFFDVYVNGIFKHSENIYDKTTKTGVFKYTISDTGLDVNRITVYLPHLVEIEISDIRLINGTETSPGKIPQKNLLCLGDSITQGMSSKSPSVTYPVQLSKFFNMNLLNQGVGGFVFDENSIDETMEYKPNIITVAYGINDMFHLNSKENLQFNCSKFFDKLCTVYKEAKIYAIVPIWTDRIDDASISGGYDTLQNVILKATSEYTNVTVINGLPLVPNISSYFADGLHPNDTGFMHYSVNLIRKITSN